LFLPLFNAAFSVGIEVLFLLIEKRLSLQACDIVEFELFLGFRLFDFCLFGKEFY
jgi:hypothetical protein